MKKKNMTEKAIKAVLGQEEISDEDFDNWVENASSEDITDWFDAIEEDMKRDDQFLEEQDSRLN